MAKHGIEPTELAAHLQGQLVAVHPAYDCSSTFRAEGSARQPQGAPGLGRETDGAWWRRPAATWVSRTSRRSPGALAWPYLYPWPQRPPGLIEAAFDELAKRWKPILDIFEANGQNCCFEVHPGEDIFDGETFEMFLERVQGHKACNILYDPSHFVLQQLDYLAYIDFYHERIKMYHVKDAEFRPTESRVCTRAMRHG